MGLLRLMLSGEVASETPPGGGGDPGSLDPLASNPAASLYAIPASSPYNSPQALVAPTYDGSGQSVHPSVVDFAQTPLGTWNGWRYWMAHTPYPASNDDYENPAILVSQNGFYWQRPLGLTRDPVYPMPPTGFSSDTHLVYDPDGDELVLVHRTTLDTVNHTVYASRSSDGITWPTDPTVSLAPQPEGQPVSPALCRVSASDWRMFALARDTRNLRMWKATSPNGPWSGPYESVGASQPDGFWGWHLDVQYLDGVFYATIDRGPLYLGNPDGLLGATSYDGLSWTRGGDFMTKTTSGWDNAEIYRASIQPHENGTHFRMWYSAHSTPVDVWGLGLTHIPRSHWPAPIGITPGSGTDYGSAVTADTPGVWWRMEADPLSSDTESDASGNGRTGTYGGLTGAHVRASSLSGDTSYATRLRLGLLYREHEAWMDVSTFTVEAIIQPESTFSTWAIMSLWGPTWGWSFRGNGSSIELTCSGGTSVGVFGQLANGVTKHVAATVSGGIATLYVNGTSVGSGSITLGTPTADTRLCLGGRWTGITWADYYTGIADEGTFYPGVALSAARILAHASAVGA